MRTPEEVAVALAYHEKECALRYNSIDGRLQTIERLLGKGVFTVIAGLLGVIGWLIIHYILVK